MWYFPSAKSTRLNCFGYNEDYSRGKRLEESRRSDGRSTVSCKRKGNVLSSCVTPKYMNALETMALTEKQQKVKVCEKQPGKNNRGS